MQQVPMAIKLSSGKLNQIASSLLLVPFHPVLNFLHCPGHLGQQLSTRGGDHNVILNSDLDNHIAVSHRLGCAVEQDMLYRMCLAAGILYYTPCHHGN